MAGTLVCVVGVFQECCDPPTCSRESNATTVLYARMGGCPTLSFLDSISHIPALLWALLLRSLLDVCATPPSAEGSFVRRILAHLRAMPCYGKCPPQATISSAIAPLLSTGQNHRLLLNSLYREGGLRRIDTRLPCRKWLKYLECWWRSVRRLSVGLRCEPHCRFALGRGRIGL